MALHLRDALHPYLPETRRVRTVGLPLGDPAVAEISRHLALLDNAEVEAAGSVSAEGLDGSLPVVAWAAGDGGARARLETVLATVPDGTVVAVVLDRSPLDAAWPQVLDAVGAADGQVL